VLLGETVKVVDRNGEATRGRLLKLTDTDLTVQTPEQERTLQAADIVEVKARRSGPLWNGALIGAAAVLIPSGIAMAKYECDGCLLPVTLWAGVGAAAGVGIDALVKGDITVMKRAAASGSASGFSVAPMLGRGRRGVLCSIRFGGGKATALNASGTSRPPERASSRQ
jgi:hypothetical protein